MINKQHPNIVFDSRSAPGCVVVKKDNRTMGIITKINKDSGQFKAGDRYYVPLGKTIYDDVFIKAPTYQEVKQQVLAALTK